MLKNSFFILFFFLFSFSLFAEDVVDGSIENSIEEETNNNSESQQYIKIKNVKPQNKANFVTIQTLDKITAKSYDNTVKINEPIVFERITIYPLFCWKSSPYDVPENKALIKVVEKTLDGKEKELFFGWIFSSSPGISGIEHPMYDVKLVNCKL